MKLLPSLKQLEYLTALAETQHFTRAADRCSVTTSTLSAGIRDLEDILGVAVAERTKRTVIMTPVGRAVSKRAHKLLCDAEDLVALAAAEHGPLTGNISLGAIPTISPFMLPGVFTILAEQYPDLELYLREEKTDTLLGRLRNGEIDTALIALPYETEQLTVKTLFEDKFLFACSAQHPLANKPQVTNADLQEQPLMLLEEGHCLRDHAIDACRLTRSPMRVQFEATSLQTLVQMVASGIGVTLLPAMAARAANSYDEKIRLIPLESPASRKIRMVWRRSSPRAEDFERLAELFLVSCLH